MGFQPGTLHAGHLEATGWHEATGTHHLLAARLTADASERPQTVQSRSQTPLRSTGVCVERSRAAHSPAQTVRSGPNNVYGFELPPAGQKNG